MNTTGSDAYLRTQVMTAPPEKLQLMLYEGAIRFATQAREKMAARDYEGSCELLVRSQRIVLELMCALRPEMNPSLCGKMGAVYNFVYNRLIEANVAHSFPALDDAVEILTVQRNIWLELLDKLVEERAGARQEQHAGAGA